MADVLDFRFAGGSKPARVVKGEYRKEALDITTHRNISAIGDRRSVGVNDRSMGTPNAESVRFWGDQKGSRRGEKIDLSETNALKKKHLHINDGPILFLLTT
jgi:hypothetical protein